MAHCLRGYFMMLFGQRAMVPRAQRSLEAARDGGASTGVTAREAAHMAALAAWVAGDFAGATARWEAIAAEHPRDMLALKLAQYGCFYTGESERMRDVVARALPALGRRPCRITASCSAAMRSASRKPAITPRPNAPAARPIERNPADIWAAHAVQHVFEMTGRPHEGVAWTERLEANWRECNNFAYHALWHRCLFLLELGAARRRARTL